jgi:hypothetical protein
MISSIARGCPALLARGGVPAQRVDVAGLVLNRVLFHFLLTRINILEKINNYGY